MGYVVEPELLDAIKNRLHDLENVELLSPDDLDIIDQKRSLRQKIDELQRGLIPPEERRRALMRTN